MPKGIKVNTFEATPGSVGAEIRRIRQDKYDGAALRNKGRWTQKAVAERAGCSQVRLNQIEKGIGKPSPELAVRLADALGAGRERFLRLVLAETATEAKQQAATAD